MDDIDKAQEISERDMTRRRGRFFSDRITTPLPFTLRTPYAAKPADIIVGERGTHDGMCIYYRHSCGHLLRIGRPVANALSLDELKWFTCDNCAVSGETHS